MLCDPPTLPRAFNIHDIITAELFAAVIVVKAALRVKADNIKHHVMFHDCMMVEQVTTGEVRHGTRADIIQRLVDGIAAASRAGLETPVNAFCFLILQL